MNTYSFSDMKYMGIYGAIGMSTVIFAFSRIIMTVKGSVNASEKLHQQLLDKIMKLPMSFYDTQVRP